MLTATIDRADLIDFLKISVTCIATADRPFYQRANSLVQTLNPIKKINELFENKTINAWYFICI